MRSSDGANGWENRKELVASVIRRNSPDIVCTQEGYWPQIEQLASILPEYHFVAAGRDDGDREGETCAVFYNDRLAAPIRIGTFWFSDAPNAPGTRHPECSHARICTWAEFTAPDTASFSVYNVHLDHESQSAREQSVEMLVERMRANSPSHPRIATGDFNMEPGNPAYVRMIGSSSAPLVDSFALIHPGQTDDGTFHDFTGRTDMGRIDYIFTSSGVEILDVKIIRDSFEGRYPSDHFPVLARLGLP